MYLFRLTYYSRNTIKDLSLPVGAEVKKIMQQSSVNNPAAGITGALVFNDHYFAQVLEGDRKSVTQAFCKIAVDARHSEIVILEAKPVSDRLFDGWAMAYAGHSPEVDRLYLKYGTTIGFAPAKMTADAFIGLVNDLVESGSRIAKTPLVEDDEQQPAPMAKSA
jgi:hypothetical protein